MKQKRVVKYLSPLDNCNICKKELTTYFVDGRTKFGCWGIMCPECHNLYGYGLGIGNGQKYDAISKIKIED